MMELSPDLQALGFIELLFFMSVVFMSRSYTIGGLATAFFTKSRYAQNHRVVWESTDSGQLFRDFLHGTQILFLDAIVFALAVGSGFFKIDSFASTQANVITFVVFFIGFEVYFYYSHRLLHHPRLFWIHRHHHRLRATNPWTSLAFSAGERSVLYIGAVLIPGIISQWQPVPLLGTSLYFAVNYILNVYGHLNVEFMPPAYAKTAGQWLSTTTYHALHHARYRGHYGLFTRFMDRIHGTEFKDYHQAQARAFAGQRQSGVDNR